MENRIKEAFRNIRAEEQLKKDTLKFIQAEAGKRRHINRRRTPLAACASLFLIFIVGLLSYNLYFTESAYIDIDVNPSIELTVNRLDRVIGVYAYNEDGKTILGSLNLKHKKYSEAVSAIVSEMEQEGYLVNNGLISATLTTNWKEGTRLTSLEQAVTKILKEHHNNSSHEIFTVDDDIKKQAEEENVSPAKYLAIAELQKVVPDATVEGCKDHSISDIRKEMHNHASETHNQDTQSESEGKHRGRSDKESNAGTEENQSHNGGERYNGAEHDGAEHNGAEHDGAERRNAEHDGAGQGSTERRNAETSNDNVNTGRGNAEHENAERVN